MAFGFIKKTWKDRISEYPTRRTLTKEDGSTELVTVSRSEGTVSQEGDAYCADNMNDLEKRVDDALNEANSNLNEIGDYEFVAKATSGGNIEVPNLSNYRFIELGYAYTDDIIINLSTIPIGLFKTGKHFFVSAKYANVYDAQFSIRYIDDTTIGIDNLYGSGCFIYLVK